MLSKIGDSWREKDLIQEIPKEFTTEQNFESYPILKKLLLDLKFNLEQERRSRILLEEELKEVSQKIIFVKEVPIAEAKSNIKKLLDKHPEGVYTSEIAEKLNLSIEIVLESIRQLKEEGKVGKTV